MPLVLVISSYVAASRVGGGIAPYVLAPMKVDPVHIPTCLFGRHPGWGPPGGGPVAADTMTKMLEGVQANNLFGLMDAVVTGHFSTPAQVAVACDAIDCIRVTPRVASHAHFPEKPIIVVDPVMGDEAPGLYIKPETASALMADLAPRADILAPNLWEFARLTASDLASLTTPEDVMREARSWGGRWLISSIPSPKGVGVLYIDPDTALLAETSRIAGKIPNGTGDMLTLRFTGGLVSGLGAEAALADAVGATLLVIDKTAQWRGSELSLAACSELLASPPLAPVRRLA
ncbi:MAG: bifunctional hydroxymethylpyrimidine kinase/phosphomethylpyrimidine kinase [Hyphomonadaceae bacterium]|nr:bifunctional hydroxymethylpyrimidine kinase/phosphomethylpyrimidine kinase [Hyphomonadaceae bacterium]